MVLAQLARIRDKEQLKPISEISESFGRAVAIFGEILGIEYKVSRNAQYERNSSGAAQIWRHTGQKIQPISGDHVDLQRLLAVGRGLN